MSSGPAGPLGPVGAPADDKPVRTPPALVDFGRALGRDMPAALKRTRSIAAKIRAVSSTPPARKGR
jgi:hypothetical protein